MVESTDLAALADNLRFAVEEGNDLIVANSFDSVEPITQLSARSIPTRSGRWSTCRSDPAWQLANVRGPGVPRARGGLPAGRDPGPARDRRVRGLPRIGRDRRRGRDRPAVHPALVRGLRGGREEGQPRRDARPSLGDRLQRPGGQQGAGAGGACRRAPTTSSRSRPRATPASSRPPRNEDFFTTGVDTDQRSLDPEHIVESVVKRTDVGVHEAVATSHRAASRAARRLRPVRERRRPRVPDPRRPPAAGRPCPRRSRTRSAPWRSRSCRARSWSPTTSPSRPRRRAAEPVSRTGRSRGPAPGRPSSRGRHDDHAG